MIEKVALIRKNPKPKTIEKMQGFEIDKKHHSKNTRMQNLKKPQQGY
jgi:hypothetical protein